MKNWKILSFVPVCIGSFLIWQMLPAPSTRAQAMKMPPGVTLKSKNYDVMGMPGMKTVTWNHLEIKPGAKWPNADMGPKVWDFCYELAGTMTVTGADGKTKNIPPGTEYTVPAGTKIPLITNKGKVTAVDIFWEIEAQ